MFFGYLPAPVLFRITLDKNMLLDFQISHLEKIKETTILFLLFVNLKLIC